MSASLTFVKIAATPTRLGWAQAYTAGNLGIVLTLKNKPAASNETPAKHNLPPEFPDRSFNSIGRELFKNIEVEYFSLEDKNLSEIKKIAQNCLKSIPNHISASLIIIATVKNVAYLITSGPGSIFIKREGKTGKLLEGSQEQKNLVTASGIIQIGDALIAVSSEFLEIIPHFNTHLYTIDDQNSLDLIMLKIHEKQEPLAVMLMATFTQSIDPSLDEEKTLQDLAKLQPAQQEKKKSLAVFLYKLKHLIQAKNLIGITILVLIILAMAIITVVLRSKIINHEKQTQDSEFQSAFAQASKIYDEGKNLLALNPKEAKDDFQNAQKILQNAPINLLSPNDRSKRNQLLNDISSVLKTPVNQANITQAPTSASPVLNTEKNNPSYSYFTQNNISIFAADNTHILNTLNKSEAVKNSSDWESIGGLGSYLNNLYLLDKKKSQILKLSPSGKTFTKSDYFTGSTPDLSKANSMTIDGSIWILNTDGKILKFTKGSQDNLSIKNLDMPLKSPTRIYTNSDSNNLYILDNGNSRIVVLNKTGLFIKQYNSSILQKAKDIDVNEKDKKIHCLSDNKIWMINI